MKYSLSVKNLDLTENDQRMLEEKLNRLTKHLVPPFHPQVMIRHDRHHRSGTVIYCRINVTQFGVVLHIERAGSTVQEALDEVVLALKQELTKRRDKRRRRR
jgi:ribosomal subunit interface protein